MTVAEQDWCSQHEHTLKLMSHTNSELKNTLNIGEMV